jgi:hypothetical protein
MFCHKPTAGRASRCRALSIPSRIGRAVAVGRRNSSRLQCEFRLITSACDKRDRRLHVGLRTPSPSHMSDVGPKDRLMRKPRIGQTRKRLDRDDMAIYQGIEIQGFR